MKDEKHVHLLDANANHWFDFIKKSYLLRCFVDKEEKTGVIRAFLSDRFKVIDNFDVLLASLQAVKESGVKLDIDYCDITDKKMYVRFVAPEIVVDSPKLLKNYHVPNEGNKGNMGIMAGFILSNSETGHGQFTVAPRAVVGACNNGMIFYDEKFAKTHLGARMEENSRIEWSEETRQKNYDLILSQTKDAIKHFVNAEYFSGKILSLENAGEEELKHPIQAVKNVTKDLSISEDKQEDILNFFIKGKDSTPFGITQALTFFAHKNEDADLQYELEKESVNILGKIDKFDIPEKKKTVKQKAEMN